VAFNALANQQFALQRTSFSPKMMRYQLSRSRKLSKLIYLSVAAWCLLLPAGGRLQSQPQDTKREILAEDFTKNRPKSKQKTATSQRRRIYRLASGAPEIREKLSSKGQIGVTVWHLRVPKKVDTGARLLLSGNEREFVAQRATTDIPLQPGARVRLSIESARNGYLYVIDREVFANGNTGPANLIFPRRNMRGGDNKVRPGQLIDIPGQSDDPNYFTASPSRRDQTGELITVVVTAKPLALEISDARTRIPAFELAEWERKWGNGAQKFEMMGGAGQQWTNEEKEAAAPSSGRRLTQDEPAPQTLFRFPEGNDDGLLVSVTLRYARPRPKGRR
jgi:Domain of unknown function (DUF4384)